MLKQGLAECKVPARTTDFKLSHRSVGRARSIARRHGIEPVIVAARNGGLPKLLAQCQEKNENVFLFLLWTRFNSSLKSGLLKRVAAIACGQSTPVDIVMRHGRPLRGNNQRSLFGELYFDSHAKCFCILLQGREPYVLSMVFNAGDR